MERKSDQELRDERYAKEARPRVWGIVAASGVAALVLGGAGALGYSQLAPSPERADYAVEATGPLAPETSFETTVHNPHGVLSQEDEARLIDDAERIEAPAVVTQLHYIVFEDNDENVNDTVEEFLRDNHPELIAEDDDSFADGVLISGVGLDPRQSFIFAGDDVADALHLWSGQQLDNAVTAIQPGVRDDNIPAGLFAGANAATDVDTLEENLYSDARGGYIGGGVGLSLGLGGAGLAATAVTGGTLRGRKKKALKARENFDTVSTEYGQLAQRLDQIDVRANSLNSPLINDVLRGQWAEVRGRFLDLHDHVDTLGELRGSDKDAAFLNKADELESAAETTRQVSYAEDNIDVLFQIEHGDEVVRKREAWALHNDVVAAQLEIDSTGSPIYKHLAEVKLATERLVEKADSDDFAVEYYQVLTDYQAALTALRNSEFADVEESSELTAPRIYDRDYRPGYGVNNFVPFWVMSSWHADNVAAEQAAQASATNTGFSSGFAGAGGSSSF